MPLSGPLSLELPTAAGTQTYLVPPITAAQFWAIRAADEPWPTIGATRTVDPRDVAAGALTDAVVEAMAADGVLDVHLRLAGSAALSWHVTGDPDAAAAVWQGDDIDAGPMTVDELDQYGRGRQNANGDWEWYEIPENRKRSLVPNEGLTLAQIWAYSDLIAADLLSEYRVDVDSPRLARRSGPWLRRLVDGLLATDSRVSRALYAELKKSKKGGDDDGDTDG